MCLNKCLFVDKLGHLWVRKLWFSWNRLLAIPKAIFQTLSVDGRLGIYKTKRDWPFGSVPFLYIPNLSSTGKVWKIAFGVASNLFHLRHNFLTRKWPSLSTKSHFLKHTEIYVSSEMIAYAPQDIFQILPVPVRFGIWKKEILNRFLPVFSA